MEPEFTVKHKFLEGSNMTFQEVFDFAFNSLIPVLQGLAKELGEDRFMEALKKVSFDLYFHALFSKSSTVSLPSSIAERVLSNSSLSTICPL